MPENVKIVLVNTTPPGNVDATARAMKIMDLDQLEERGRGRLVMLRS